MADRRSKIPQSYDEITRRTVVDPDSSFRPTKAQRDEADVQFRDARAQAQMTDQERIIYARVARELLSDSSLGEIGFEVERGTVTLHGRVRDARTVQVIEERARAVDGVENVINQLVVGS